MVKYSIELVTNGPLIDLTIPFVDGNMILGSFVIGLNLHEKKITIYSAISPEIPIKTIEVQDILHKIIDGNGQIIRRGVDD